MCETIPSSIGPLKLPRGELCSDHLGMTDCLASSLACFFFKEVPLYQETQQVFDGHIERINISIEWLTTVI